MNYNDFNLVRVDCDTNKKNEVWEEWEITVKETFPSKSQAKKYLHKMIGKKKCNFLDYVQPIKQKEFSEKFVEDIPVDDLIETKITDLENYRADWLERKDDAEVQLATIEGQLLQMYEQFYKNVQRNHNSCL